MTTHNREQTAKHHVSTSKSTLSKKGQTDWCDYGTQPECVGVYETYSPEEVQFQYWNGSAWAVTASTPDMADLLRKMDSSFQTPKWREVVRRLQ